MRISEMRELLERDSGAYHSSTDWSIRCALTELLEWAERARESLETGHDVGRLLQELEP